MTERLCPHPELHVGKLQNDQFEKKKQQKTDSWSKKTLFVCVHIHVKNTSQRWRVKLRTKEIARQTCLKTVCTAEAAAGAGASSLAGEMMPSPNTLSNLSADTKEAFFVKVQTQLEEECVCFSLVSVDGGVSY